MLHLDNSGYGYKPRPKTIMTQYGGASISVAMDTQRRMLSLLKATVFLFGLFACATGEIRCYCNDASCVRTGYMCKSAMGRCFSQLTYERDSTRSVHGCAEGLPPADRDLCEGSGNVAETKTGGDKVQWPILICCKEEMCNYMDNLDISIYVTKSNGTKDSAWSNLADQQQPLRNPEDEVYLPGGPPPYIVNSPSDNELWFKAAVIAVPIAGGFILVLLVLLAVRVLRNDNRRHRQLVQMRRHRSLAKAQLYVADHFYQNELVGEKCAECQGAQCQGQGAACQGPAQSQGRGDPARPVVCGVNGGVGVGVGGGGGGVTVVGCGIKSKSNHSRHSINKDQRHAGQLAGSSPYRDVHLKLDHSRNGYEKIQPLSDGSTFDDDSYESVVVWGDPGKLEMAAPV